MTDIPEPLAGLIRDHRVIEETVASAHKAISTAAGRPTEAAIVAAAIEQLRDLEAFAAVDLTVHIAKEELFLFPALRAAAEAQTANIIEDMLAQHDEVRDRNAEVQHVLDAIDSHHDEVAGETASLSATLHSADGELSPATLNKLYDTVKKLDWILQGHFLDEEENLFDPAIEWFSDEEFASLAGQMQELEVASEL
jgi:iron-sulfur cluster repair protein YtfE (RIC family)